MKLILDNNNAIIKVTTNAVYAHVEGTGNTTHWAECSEENARKDYENRKITSEEIIDGGILAPEEKVIIPFNAGANKIVEAEIPEGINVLEYKYIDGEFVINAKVRANNIKQELETLDTTINRATEDLYVATGIAAYTNVQEVIDRKNALRAELASLEV